MKNEQQVNQHSYTFPSYGDEKDKLTLTTKYHKGETCGNYITQEISIFYLKNL